MPARDKGDVRRVLTTTLFGALLLAGSAAAVSAQEITLRVADSFSENHYVSKQLIVPWMKRVEELTGGKVAFDYFPGEALAKSKDLLDAAKNQVADIAYVAPLYISDRLPLSSIVALPGLPETRRRSQPPTSSWSTTCWPRPSLRARRWCRSSR